MDTAKLKAFWHNNSTHILYGASTVSLASTVVFAVRAGAEANRILSEEKMERGMHYRDMTRREKVKILWPVFVPTAISLCATATATFFLHRVGENRALALASAASISQRMYEEYVAKVEEKLSADQVQEIRNEIAQDHYAMDDDPLSAGWVLNDDEIIIRDGFSGRYFKSSINDVKSAVNELNKTMLDCGYATLTDFYELVGLDPTTVSGDVGWNTDKLLEVSFSTIVLSDPEVPCMELVFHNQPDAQFNKPF